MSGVSLRGAIDAKCRDCGAAGAGARWREHITACPVLNCPLWPVRPMSRHVPEFLARRDATALPSGWSLQSEEASLHQLRNGHFGPLGDAQMVSRGADCAAGETMHPCDNNTPARCRDAVIAGIDRSEVRHA
jgi:hypothetical protein